jgi:hypothetical protein
MSAILINELANSSQQPPGQPPDCSVCLSKSAKARASVIGWLSKQQGYATNPLVKEFCRTVRAKHSTLSLNEKKAFFIEHTFPSNRRYRITRFVHSRP